MDVRYRTQGISINGKNLDSSSALDVLRRARDLSPAPDILVTIEGSFEAAVPFLRAISDEGLCDLAKCEYRLRQE